MTTHQVGYIVGSLSAKSINRILATALAKLAPPGLELSEIPIRDLPLYNHDMDGDYPPEGRALKDAIERVDALLIVTPEYNRSIPGGLKNAIDWASRPWQQNSLTGKPTAVIGASIGAIGTAVAQQHLRNVLTFCDAPQLQAPEAYVQYTKDRFSADGDVTDEGTRKFLETYLQAFETFVGQTLRGRAA
ncbi:MAG: NAD(P)H-dependent oxidoreductase [Patulibacter sp.]|nr:NAD(P)H-dependent oxidoreductase [Patulibacter sp.]